ncbi:MAG: CPBP family intramembrane glutamic endopeptidase [Balneolaceae bacterium]
MTAATDISGRPYFRETSSLLYSYLICLPLLLLYEFLILFSQPDQDFIVRISVDAWFKSVFTYFGLNALSFTFIIAAIAGLVILYRNKQPIRTIRKKYFAYMILEALIYAVLIAIIISNFLHSLLNLYGSASLAQMSKLQLFALSLGAGLYEELFFRVILISILVYILNKVFRKKQMAYFISAIIAALLFSLVHYTGEFGDTFAIGSFLFRFLFGLALNAIFILRGFGMAAWTHALYDLLVIFGSS